MRPLKILYAAHVKNNKLNHYLTLDPYNSLLASAKTRLLVVRMIIFAIIMVIISNKEILC